MKKYLFNDDNDYKIIAAENKSEAYLKAIKYLFKQNEDMIDELYLDLDKALTISIDEFESLELIK